jgi:hypothetical protein
MCNYLMYIYVVVCGLLRNLPYFSEITDYYVPIFSRNRMTDEIFMYINNDTTAHFDLR